MKDQVAETISKKQTLKTAVKKNERKSICLSKRCLFNEMTFKKLQLCSWNTIQYIYLCVQLKT